MTIIRTSTCSLQKKPHGKPDSQCIAHCSNGFRCPRAVQTSFSTRHKACPVPYCERHLKSGDDALKVYQHPKGFGKILVARFNLPKGYRMVYHGLRQTTGSDPELDPDEDRTLWFYPAPGFEVNGYLDPSRCPGSVLQFAANGGPQEVANIRQNDRSFGHRNGSYGGMEYEASMPIPAGTQLVHNYGSEWWKDRPELKRSNVGTDRFPAPKRKVRKMGKETQR